MEPIHQVVTINIDEVDDFVTSNIVLDKVHYPFIVRDISLPDDDSGFVYMPLSLSNRDYTYIGKTKNIVNRIDAHNAVNGSNATRQWAIYPYSLFAFIYEFNGDNHIMYYIEQKWKETRNSFISQGINDPTEFARRGNEVINSRHSNFTLTNVSNELWLVLLLRW